MKKAMKRNNRMVALLLAIFLVVSCNLVIAFANGPVVQVGGIGYSLDDLNATATVVSRPLGYSGDITIPSTIEHDGKSYAVTAIGNRAFYGCLGLTSIQMPDTICWIGQGAFYCCCGLSSVTIPDATERIGDGAFQGCFNLRYMLFGSDSRLEHVGYRCFCDCWRLCRLMLPESLLTVGLEAFGDSTIVFVSEELPDKIPPAELEDDVFEEDVFEEDDFSYSDDSASHDSSLHSVHDSALMSSGSSIHLDSSDSKYSLSLLAPPPSPVSPVSFDAHDSPDGLECMVAGDVPDGFCCLDAHISDSSSLESLPSVSSPYSTVSLDYSCISGSSGSSCSCHSFDSLYGLRCLDTSVCDSDSLQCYPPVSSPQSSISFDSLDGINACCSLESTVSTDVSDASDSLQAAMAVDAGDIPDGPVHPDLAVSTGLSGWPDTADASRNTVEADAGTVSDDLDSSGAVAAVHVVDAPDTFDAPESYFGVCSHWLARIFCGKR